MPGGTDEGGIGERGGAGGRRVTESGRGGHLDPRGGPGAHRDERVAGGSQLGDDERKRRHGLSAVPATIVQVDHGAGEGRTHHAADDCPDSGLGPVPRIDRVAHGGQAPRRDLVEDGRVPGVIGGPDAAWRNARLGLDRRLGHVDLSPDPRRGKCGQVGMTPGVVLHRIPRLGHQTRELRVARHLVADLKERCRYPRTLERGQDLRRVRARTIVEGQGHHPRSRATRHAGSLGSGESRRRAGHRASGWDRQAQHHGQRPRRQHGAHGSPRGSSPRHRLLHIAFPERPHRRGSPRGLPDGPPGQAGEHDRGDDAHRLDLDHPEQALATHHSQAGHGP